MFDILFHCILYLHLKYDTVFILQKSAWLRAKNYVKPMVASVSKNHLPRKRGMTEILHLWMRQSMICVIKPKMQRREWLMTDQIYPLSQIHVTITLTSVNPSSLKWCRGIIWLMRISRQITTSLMKGSLITEPWECTTLV